MFVFKDSLFQTWWCHCGLKRYSRCGSASGFKDQIFVLCVVSKSEQGTRSLTPARCDWCEAPIRTSDPEKLHKHSLYLSSSLHNQFSKILKYNNLLWMHLINWRLSFNLSELQRYEVWNKMCLQMCLKIIMLYSTCLLENDFNKCLPPYLEPESRPRKQIAHVDQHLTLTTQPQLLLNVPFVTDCFSLCASEHKPKNIMQILIFLTGNTHIEIKNVAVL